VSGVPRPRPRGHVGVALTAAVMLVVAGCATRPPDTVALAFYMRNQSGMPFQFSIDGGENGPINGPVHDEPASTGCGWVDRDWILSVWPGDEGDAADAAAARLTSDQAGDVDPVVLWLDVDPARRIRTGAGVPVWWDSDIQRCPGM
jgi:hypothetical protein